MDVSFDHSTLHVWLSHTHRGLHADYLPTAQDTRVSASHTAQPRSAFGGTVTYPIAMPPLITATAKVHSADESQVGAKNGGGIYRWPEFDSRAGVSRLQPYPRLAHASYSLRKATTPKNPVPLEPNYNVFFYKFTTKITRMAFCFVFCKCSLFEGKTISSRDPESQ